MSDKDEVYTKAVELDELLYKMDAERDLEGQRCMLYHHPQDPAGKAVDYLNQKFGFDGNVQDILRVPICQDCVDALLGDEWVLMYCVHCNESRWVSRKYSFHAYPDGLKIKWIDGCPGCVSFK